VIFLSVSSEIAAQRGGYGQERYEKEEMQKRVRGVFVRLREDPRDAEDWRVVDAGVDIEEVTERIWANVQPILDEPQPEIKYIL
jgi:dTMP kinase